MAVVATIVGGVWVPVLDQGADKPLIDTATGDVDRIVALLGQAVRLAQSLSPADARRVRDIFHAAQGMLSATTYLDRNDQRLFERALKDRCEG